VVVRRPSLATTAQRGAREVDRFTIYGERCSGTKWLTVLIEDNLGLPVTWEFGWKHFFGGTQKLPGRDATGSTLFVCVVRDPVDWVNSLYRMPHHLTGPQVRGGVDAFMTEPVEFEGKPEADGRTGMAYKSVMQMRHRKCDYLVRALPQLVDRYVLVRYEDLVDDLAGTMARIRASVPQAHAHMTKPLVGEARASTKVNAIPAHRVYGAPHFDAAIELQLGYKVT